MEAKIVRVLSEVRRLGYNTVINAVKKEDFPTDVAEVVIQAILSGIERDAREVRDTMQYLDTRMRSARN